MVDYSGKSRIIAALAGRFLRRTEIIADSLADQSPVLDIAQISNLGLESEIDRITLV